MPWKTLWPIVRSQTKAQYFVAEHDKPSDIDRFASRSIASIKSLGAKIMAKTYGVGIMGAGNISAAYLRLAPLFKGLEVRAVADILPGGRQEARRGVRRQGADARTSCSRTPRST